MSEVSIFPPAIRRDYRTHARNYARVLADRERSAKTDPWDYYGSSLREFNSQFHRVLKKGKIESLLIDINRFAERQPVCIDLAGQGQYFYDLYDKGINISAGLSVCLGHNTHHLDRVLPGKLNIYTHMDGDLMEDHTWDNIKSWCAENGSADLMTLAPVGGSEFLWDWNRTYRYSNRMFRHEHIHCKLSFFIHMKQALSLLNIGGSLLVACENYTIRSWLLFCEPWLKLPYNLHIITTPERNVMRLIKTEPSPNPDIGNVKLIQVVS